MSRPHSYSHRHLTLSDRIYIEQELMQGSSFKSIAAFLHKDPTTISKVKRHSKTVHPSSTSTSCRHTCTRYSKCTVCKKDPGVLCCRRKQSAHCRKKLCRSCFAIVPSLCEYSRLFKCERPKKPPYVCNGCKRIKICYISHDFRKNAHEEYEENLPFPFLTL